MANLNQVTDTISGSFTGDGSGITTLGTITSGDLTAVLPTGTVSSSVQVTSILPAGTISASAQIDHDSTTNYVSGEHFLQSAITTVGTVTSGDVSAVLPVGSVSASAQISLPNVTGYVANEHIDHSSVTLTAGSGLTGGGDITESRTFNIGAGDGIIVNADSITIDTGSVHFTGGVGSQLDGGGF